MVYQVKSNDPSDPLQAQTQQTLLFIFSSDLSFLETFGFV